MSSRDSSLALNRTEIGVLLPRPGGDFGAADRMPPTAVPDDVGDVAADADAEVEPDRLLLLPLALLVALLAVEWKIRVKLSAIESNSQEGVVSWSWITCSFKIILSANLL